MSEDRSELEALRRLAELEAKAGASATGVAQLTQPERPWISRALEPLPNSFGSGANNAAYNAGGAVTDIAARAGLPPNVAAGVGYTANVGMQLLPMLMSGDAPTANVAQSQNAVRDATLKAAQNAGYVVPPSAVNPSWVGNRLESIAGKAALGQEAAATNQRVTNALARKALGLPENAALSEGALEQLRNGLAQPYRDVAALPKVMQQPASRWISGGGQSQAKVAVDPAKALEELKQARFNANLFWKDFSRTGNSDKFIAATKADALAKQLEQSLETAATASGSPDLVAALRNARTEIAKTHDVERALNIATGDVSAPILGRALDKGAPLSGELETIGRFQQAFPAYAREGERIPTPGVSKSEALAGAILGVGGTAALGPYGAAAGALPLVSGPIRAALLSQPYQRLLVQPSYASTGATRAAMLTSMLMQSQKQGQ